MLDVALSHQNLVNFDRHDNFPRPGITFYDLQGVSSRPQLWRQAMHELTAEAEQYDPTAIVAADARGFLIAGYVAPELNCKIVMARKPGKLPGPLHRVTYGTEYSTDALEVCVGLLNPSDRVLIVDDVLATGGTVRGIENLIKMEGATPVALIALLEITELRGRDHLCIPVHSWAHT